jgi:hypothetical protein
MPEYVIEKDETQTTADNGQIDEPVTVRIHVSQERLQGMKWGTMRKAQGDLNAQSEFIARFMLGSDGTYLKQEDAFAILDELDVIQVGELAQQIVVKMQDAAAPKV